jgi:hypothetical protein
VEVTRSGRLGLVDQDTGEPGLCRVNLEEGGDVIVTIHPKAP